MKNLLAAIAFLSIAFAAQAQAPDTAWPRVRKAADGTEINVYQPQIERWAENRLSARAAVSVAPPGSKEPQFGVIELEARTDIDKSADRVLLSAVRIVKGSFPGATPEQGEQYLATLRASLPKDGWPVSAQALQANLAITQARAGQKAVAVKNDPPQILFRAAPSLLVLVDGEPALRAVKDAPGLMRVINTTALIVLDESSATYYLRALGGWRASKEVTGQWTSAAPPSQVDQLRMSLDKQYDPMEGRDGEGKPMFEPGVVPQVIVATKATELLQSKGEPQYSPIPGTKLLYMSNSSNDIFMEVGGQQYYVLISGRWFTGKSLQQGPWAFVAGKSLPADFTKIPADHPMADVLVSVPNTTQAREAMIANQIPQTATVQRSVEPTPVVYDGGAPQWKPIDGTPLTYAFNTGVPVIQIDAKTYYMAQNGVWFAAAAPGGPWKVASTVPTVIYTIPATSPLHYVTYVRVYSSTSSTVFVGYTPGYYGTVVSTDGVVVYGTGYVYPAYIGAYWYPPPPTYGWGFGFATGVFWGFAISGGWHNPCCWGGGGPMVVHHNNININNSYNRWGGKSNSVTGPGGRNVKTSQVGQTTFAKGSGSNNVYAGRDGNVYRRDDSGNWQQHQKGSGWSDVGNPDRNRPEQRPAQGDRDRVADRGAENRQRNLSAETRQSLDRQAQARDRGAQRSSQFQGGGGFHGGGGARGGGGGRGGGRR